MRPLLVLVVLAVFARCATAVAGPRSRFLSSALASSARAATASLLGAAALSLPLPLPAFAANDALAAATRAMTQTKEREVRVRDFDQLPPAAKKRAALERCKDSSARRDGGFKSASECTAAVLSGDYSSIIGGRQPEPVVVFDSSRGNSATVRAAPTPAAPEPTAAPKQASTKEPVSAVRKTSSVPPQQQRRKTQDLSGVSSAGLKRRALASCKKSDIRNEAKMGSESSCTERVMAGDYARIIEVLEYR